MRQFLSCWLLAHAIRRVVAAMVMVGIVGASGAVRAAAETLQILTWDAYIAPKLVAAFKQETGIDIVITTFETDPDAYAKLKAAPGRFDIANPVDYLVPVMAQGGMLEKFEPYQLAGFANLSDAWRSRAYDPRNEYSIPFHWGTTSFVVDTDRYSGDIDTYKVLFDPPPTLQGKAGLMKGAGSIIKAAMLYLGLPTCSTAPADLAKTRDLMVKRFSNGEILTIGDVVDRLSSGTLAMGIAWNGDALRARQKRPSLRYAYPREGVMVFSDALVMPKNPPHRAAAVKFIDFMMRPENAALQTNFTRYANTIRGSDAFIDPELLDAPEVIVPTSVGISFQQYCDNDAQLLHEKLMEEILKAVQRR